MTPLRVAVLASLILAPLAQGCVPGRATSPDAGTSARPAPTKAGPATPPDQPTAAPSAPSATDPAQIAPAAPLPALTGPGARLPNHPALDLAGAQRDLPGLAGGKPMLVNLWATWCTPCIHELPTLVALHRRWSPRGLVVVGVSLDEDPSAAQAEAKKHQLPYPSLLDPAGELGRLFGMSSLPTTYLYDGAGRLVWRKQDELTPREPTLDAALERLLPALGGQ